MKEKLMQAASEMIKNLAIQRRMLKDYMTEEEVDNYLSECGTKYQIEVDEMEEGEFLMYVLMDTFKMKAKINESENNND